MNKNNKLHLSIALIVLSLAVGAQDSSSILSGQITGPFDGLVANAPIQVTRIDSGERWRSRSDADGRYQFEELPAGDYRIQINIGCCEYKSYRQEPVEVVQSSPRVFDIQLEQGFQLNTIGDDFAIAAAQILEELDLPDS
jgi:hypothetical protein